MCSISMLIGMPYGAALLNLVCVFVLFNAFRCVKQVVSHAMVANNKELSFHRMF